MKAVRRPPKQIKKNMAKIFTKESEQKGGKAGNTGGFAANRELASIAGKIGGAISKRGKAKK